jgi:hypothetical protein
MGDSDYEGNQKKTKSVRRRWSTPEQYAWLESLIPSYQKAQAGGFRKLAEFWPNLFEEWFIRWPEPTVMPSVNNGDASATDATDATDAVAVARNAEKDKAKALQDAVENTKGVSVSCPQ